MFEQEVLLECDFGTLAAATALETRYRNIPGGNTSAKWRLESAQLVPQIAVTADGTNYSALTIKNGSTTLATRSYIATNSVAGTPENLTLSGGDKLEITEQTGVLTLAVTKTGTGVASWPVVQMRFKKVR